MSPRLAVQFSLKVLHESFPIYSGGLGILGITAVFMGLGAYARFFIRNSPKRCRISAGISTRSTRPIRALVWRYVLR